jgi:pullulanase
MVRTLLCLLVPLLLAACGGAGPDTQSAAASRKQALAADDATTLTVHYRRANASGPSDNTGWQIHTWNAAVDPGWNNGHNASRFDDFGAVYEVPLTASSGDVGYLFHKLDGKDHGGADQKYTLKPGKNEIWRVQGDNATYTSNPLGALPPDVHTVRVHYLRPGGDFANWGLHLWQAGGVDVTRLAPGIVIDQWPAAIGFERMPNYSATATEVVFDIPVLNPRQGATSAALQFIIHGKAPNEANKDGRADDIIVPYAAYTARNQVIEIWMVQGDATIYTSTPDTRRVSTTDARAYWLSRQLLQWPSVDGSGTVKLYHSAAGLVRARKDAKVAGADGAITLEPYTDATPTALAQRFKFIGAGSRWRVKDADVALLPMLLKRQLVLVQENASGLVQNATTAQLPGVLDDLYAAAADEGEFGVTIQGGRTHFKLWAPTAQQVTVMVHDSASGPVTQYQSLSFNANTGSWSGSRAGDLSGKYYRFGVSLFVKGVGVVRNIVTDPYALSLSADSRLGFIANLNDPTLMPPGWATSTPPAKVQHSSDMSIYELHVRDFSASDTSVRAAWRGKYLAFTETNSNGMKHMKALGDAGMTDVHLLPVYDIASVPEVGCLTPNPSGGADSETQQAAVSVSAGNDCFNWGYDPWHYNAPEGSYATDANDGARRIIEFRQMVMALHAAGLRVGMDVVYNHTSASGQNARSVLDRIVPGYYHRLNADGNIETSTCCENTATEHNMMGKLMIDSTIVWARDYKISSFRFDVMGHQPRAVMEVLKAKVKLAAGRDVQLIGEGWNFGEVTDGARFVQASMWSLNGSGIGSFNPFMRDAARGGSPFDAGAALIANQGFINGLFYDANTNGTGRSAQDLMRQGDLIRAGLAGSIRSYLMKTRLDGVIPLEQLEGAGFVLEPSEVVNYVENHDNQTFFDNNAFKLPTTTSREDRARVQMLGAALVNFSQGVAYHHAGVDTLRSKSFDRNSYDSGDWFNRIDWSYGDNHFGMGVPRAGDNGDNWPVMKPLLANALIKPTPADIAWTRDAFRDLLKIRASTTLLRLRSAADIKQRLVFFNTGSTQVPTVMAGYLNGNGYAGAGFKELVYLVNVDKVAQTVGDPLLVGRAFTLHPVHLAPNAADTRAATATFNSSSGRFTVPARTAVVFVVN